MFGHFTVQSSELLKDEYFIGEMIAREEEWEFHLQQYEDEVRWESRDSDIDVELLVVQWIVLFVAQVDEWMHREIEKWDVDWAGLETRPHLTFEKQVIVNEIISYYYRGN